MTFIKNVLANAAGGILVTFILWLLGLWTVIWNALKFLWSLIFKGLVYEFSVPVWQILVLILALKCLRLVIRKYKRKKLNEIEAENKKLGLTKNEDLIVRLLVDADGRWLRVVDMAGLLAISRLLIDQAVESLLRKQFIDDRYNISEGASYRLSSIGRDYVIDKGYIEQNN